MKYKLIVKLMIFFRIESHLLLVNFFNVFHQKNLIFIHVIHIII